MTVWRGVFLVGWGADATRRAVSERVARPRGGTGRYGRDKRGPPVWCRAISLRNSSAGSVRGVATLVPDGAAVAGAALKVMAAGRTVTLGAIGESITLDTALAPVTVTTTAENAEVTQEGNLYTVVAKGTAEDWPEDPSTVTGKTAGEAYGLTGELADAKADTLATWAKANGVAYTGAAGAIKIEAYLLNVANTDAAIAEGKANFKIPAITVDANGTVTVTPPHGGYNGVITVKGSVTVNGTYDLDKADATARFFKAFLSVK